MRGVGSGADEPGEDESFFIRLLGMANATVAADAGEAIVVVGAAGIDVVSDIRVAMPAGILRHRAAAGFHGNRLMEIAGREGVGMPETVIGLGKVFPNDVVGRVAIVTGGDRAVTGLQPGIIIILHDVAVRTRFRVVREIRPAAGVNERISSHASRQPEQHPSGNGCGANASALIYSRRGDLDALFNGPKRPRCQRWPEPLSP